MDLQLAGKHAIVTGGTRGIGRAVTERLLAEGMSVSFCARDADGVSRAADELGVLGLVGDVWGEAVDVVVPNASALGGIANDASGWQRSFDVDVLPAVLLVEASWVTGQNVVVDGGFTQRIGY